MFGRFYTWPVETAAGRLLLERTSPEKRRWEASKKILKKEDKNSMLPLAAFSIEILCKIKVTFLEFQPALSKYWIITFQYWMRITVEVLIFHLDFKFFSLSFILHYHKMSFDQCFYQWRAGFPIEWPNILLWTHTVGGTLRKGLCFLKSSVRKISMCCSCKKHAAHEQTGWTGGFTGSHPWH